MTFLKNVLLFAAELSSTSKGYTSCESSFFRKEVTKLVRKDELVSVRSVSVIAGSNGSAYVAERTQFLSANEELMFTVRAIQVKGKRCLMSINDGPETRFRMREKTLDEVVKEIVRREADERGIRIRPKT